MADDTTTAVLTELEPLIQWLARRTDERHAEDLAQVGRVAVWQALSRYRGDSPEEFRAFARKTAQGAMSDARRELTYQGISQDTAKRWESALRLSDGDPVAAERLACSAESHLPRMTPEMARAARIAWQHTAPLSGHTETLTAEVPTEARGERQEVTQRRVVGILDAMPWRQRLILECAFRIGDDEEHYDDAELAEWMGVSVRTMRGYRSKALVRFRQRYERLYGLPT